MRYIDHPDAMMNNCPLFKSFLPPVCIELEIEPTFVNELKRTLDDLNSAVDHAAQIGSDEAFDAVDAFRTEILDIFSKYCLDSQKMATVGHGGWQYQIDDIIYQFTKTSLTHPKREDLVFHAFSFIAFTDLVLEPSPTAELLGEDCGAHYTMLHKDPKQEDLEAIEKMIKSTEAATFDDFLNVFN